MEDAELRRARDSGSNNSYTLSNDLLGLQPTFPRNVFDTEPMGVEQLVAFIKDQSLKFHGSIRYGKLL